MTEEHNTTGEGRISPVPMIPTGGLRCLTCRSFTSGNFQRRCFTDTSLKCQGRTFYVHRLVLIDRSHYFESLFLRRPSDDFSTVVVDQCRDHLVLRALLIWCYEDKFNPANIYPDDGRLSEADVEAFPAGNDAERQLRGCVLLWAAAEMFGIDGLKVAIWKRVEAMSFFLDEPGPQGAISLDCASDILRDLFHFTGDGPRGIRSRYLAMRWVSDHFAALFGTSFFNRALEISGWFPEFRQFKTDAKLWTRECPSCYGHWTTEMADSMVYDCSSCQVCHTVDEWAHGVGDAPHPVTMPAQSFR